MGRGSGGGSRGGGGGRINEEQQYADILKQVESTNLTQKEEDTLKAYSRYATELNKVLRSDEPLKRSTAKDIKNLDQAIEKLPEWHGTVYRGLRIREKDLPQFIADMSKDHVTYQSYLSSSVERKLISPFATPPEHIFEGRERVNFVGVEMKINSKHGRAVFSKSIQPGQKEVIFARNSKFTIKDFRKSEDRYLVTLDEI